MRAFFFKRRITYFDILMMPFIGSAARRDLLLETTILFVIWCVIKVYEHGRHG